MKIINLEVENIKRLKAVEITPHGDVVVISGKNRQGKSSLLDSIWWLLAGTKHIQAVPIRRGETKGRIKAHLGEKEVEFIVERKFSGENSTLSVTTADGYTPPGGAQTVLNAFLGELSFDPLAFDRMGEREKFDELLRVFPIGIDPRHLDGLNKTDYAKRTDVNRDAKAKRTQAAAIVVPPDLAESPVDESKLLDRIQDAADGNAQIEQRKAKRADAARQIEGKGAAAKNLRDTAEAKRREAERLDAEAAATDAEIVALQQKLDTAPPLPEPVDISSLRTELDAAKVTNQAIADRQRRAALETEAKALETESARLTEQMAQREREKQEAVAAAKFPVEGLGFGDGIVTLDGVPFDQASASETLKVSVAIGIAANPKLRVMLIRDGSLLDDDSRAQIAAMAKDADTQLWLEIARTDEPSGFIIEDGTARPVEGSDAP